MNGLLNLYSKGVKEYYSDKKSWDQLCDEDENRAVNDIWDYIMPYVSFFCFILGCLSGAYALFGSG